MKKIIQFKIKTLIIVLIIKESASGKMPARFKKFERVKTRCKRHLKKGMAGWPDSRDMCTIFNVRILPDRNNQFSLYNFQIFTL